jgi:hypothetical protein
MLLFIAFTFTAYNYKVQVVLWSDSKITDIKIVSGVTVMKSLWMSQIFLLSV